MTIRRGTTSGPANWAYPLGLWSAVIATLLGIIYAGVILFAVIDGQFTFPPPPWLQLYGGFSTLVTCPFLVVMMASLHQIMPSRKQALSLASLVFTVMFALSVSINRFSQLGPVRQAAAAGQTDAIHWFEAYGSPSIMLGMEYLGWAWLLGLAMLCAAPLFEGGPVRRRLRVLTIVYGILGLVAALGFLMNSPLSLVGFFDWGVVLVIITYHLSIFFQRAGQGRYHPHDDLARSRIDE